MATYEQELQKAQQELNKWFLGKTSKRYESGSGGPATISSGVGDPGGISYGSYQLSTTKGALAEYLKYSDNYNHAFDGLKPKTKEFDQKWKELANNDPQFHQSQHEFIALKHYQPQLQVLKQAGFDFSERGKAVQDMVWSLAVQHKDYTVDKIKRAQDESGLNFKTATDAEIIEAVYDSKLRHYKQDFRRSSPQVQESVRKRILSEKPDLLRLDRYEKLLEGQQQEKEKNTDNGIEQHKPLSKYEETRAMLQNLLNDTDGSYAKKLVAENPGEVIRFSENNVQQQQELAERENRNMQQQEEPQRSFSRSV
jgi:hypothetical protein